MTRKKTIQDAIAQDMGERSIGSEKPEHARNAAPVSTGKYKSHIISIRFDPGDYDKLKQIANDQGTTGASLIRKAVKDIIKSVYP